jgi:hypothetical protein
VIILADLTHKNKIKYFKKKFIFLDFKKKFFDKNILMKKKLQ